MNPGLAIYPLLGLAAALGSLFFVIFPTTALVAFIGYSSGIQLDENNLSLGVQIAGYVYLALCLLFLQIVAVFSASAFFLAADAALKGESITVGKAYNLAWRKRTRIMQYAVVGVVVNLVLSQISERLGVFGKVIGLVGNVAWALMTIFAIPILVSRDIGPIDAVKQSIALFKKTWGENVVGGASIALVSMPFVLLIVAVAVAFGFMFAAGSIGLAVLIPVEIVMLLALFAVVAYFQCLTTIFNAALYRYADTGDYVGPFSHEMLAGAYQPKR